MGRIFAVTIVVLLAIDLTRSMPGTALRPNRFAIDTSQYSNRIRGGKLD